MGARCDGIERVRPRRHPQRRRPPARTSKRSCTRGRWGSCTASAPPRPTPRPRSAPTIGILATLPESTVQRILGGRTGRLLHERAKGIDRRVVVPTHLPSPTARAPNAASPSTPSTPPPSAPSCSPSPSSCDRLRNRQQAARTVTLTVTLGGHSQITRSHRLESGPSAHTDDLRQTLYDLYADCGSQRARIRAVTGG
ncbi:DinB/UmuC family translesion DNA polymerase [Streptomyces microflavus]|uniref:DinB/UmuC family translesion DNA polymerase n=1 Tax=Streptomyces microflavus TaxID=1919 RepID=UPI00367D9B81